VSALLWSSGNETPGVVVFRLEEARLGTQAAAIAVSTIAVLVAMLTVPDRLGRRLPAGGCPGAERQEPGMTQASETATCTFAPIAGASALSIRSSSPGVGRASRTSWTGPL